MENPRPLEELASYVPSFLAASLAKESQPSPKEERLWCAALFADISGFTPLTERLAQEGPEGAEKLSRILNVYFDALIELISLYGGEIVRFAGDAPIVLWFEKEHTPEAKKEAVLRAAQCSLALKEKLNAYKVAEQVSLSMRIGVGAGEVSLYHVGGTASRWELLVAGAPLRQVAEAERAALPGEAVLSKEARELLPEEAIGEPTFVGSQVGLRLRALRGADSTRSASSLVARPPEEVRERLRAFIPRTALARIDAGLAGSFPELRRVTVLFLQLPEVLAEPYGRLGPLQEAFSAIQEEVYQRGGSINQFLVDDKGTTLVVIWGLPTCTHEDNAVRAVQAALSLQAKLQKLGHAAFGGISSSRAFAGDRGNATRREYAVIGKGVNLAARLMQAAAPNKILCDEVTAQEAARRIDFVEEPKLALKGWSAPVSTFLPKGFKEKTQTKASLVGRQRERGLLEEGLRKLLAGRGSTLCLEGEAGIGKTQLLGELLALGQEQGVLSVLGAGDSIEHSTPYFAWRSILVRLLSRGESDPRAELMGARLLELLKDDPAMLSLAPLLNAIVPLDLDETPLTAQMDKQVRSDNTNRLMLVLLQKIASTSRLVLVLDDIQWLDSASLELARLVGRDVSPLFFVLATRPMSEPIPLAYAQLLSSGAVARVRLETLSKDEISALVQRRLSAEKISPEAAALLYQKTEGHPFFSEELAYALRDLGILVVVDGEVRLASNAALGGLHFPETLNGVIASRIDRLTPSQQILLKAASVIGRVFSRKALLEIQPLDAEESALAKELEALRKLDLTSLETPEPDIAYLFKHILTQEVAYGLMLFSQRRALHRAVAQWYEKTHKDDLSPYFALLAHHWQKAEELPKALDYLEKAGEQALHSFANEEAVRFFREALSLADAVSVPASRRERWERQMGEAFYSMGRLAESQAHLLRALSLLNAPVPEAPKSFALSLLGQAFVQAAHRVALPAPQQTERELLLESARTYETLALTYYFGDKILGAVYATLQMVNLAERIGPSEELARAYAASCMAAGLVPLHSLATIYERRAKEIALGEKDPHSLAWVLQATGAYRAGLGEWESANKDLEQAHSLYEQLGDRRGCDQEKAIMGWVANAQGDFTRGVRLYSEAYHSARKRDDPQAQNWGLCGQVETALQNQSLSAKEASEYMEEAKALLVNDLGRPEEIRVFGLLAMARCRQGRFSEARSAAEEGAKRVSLLAPPTSFYSLEGYAGIAECLLTLFRDQREASLAKASLKACRGMQGYARVFPAGRPRAELLWGFYYWHQNQKQKAIRSWQRSEAAAKELRMPYEEARACYALATHLEGKSTKKNEYSHKAHSLFAQLDAPVPV